MGTVTARLAETPPHPEIKLCLTSGRSPHAGRGEDNQTILIDMSGKPSSLHRSTSPFTTGPTFSGVPE